MGTYAGSDGKTYYRNRNNRSYRYGDIKYVFDTSSTGEINRWYIVGEKEDPVIEPLEDELFEI